MAFVFTKTLEVTTDFRKLSSEDIVLKQAKEIMNTFNSYVNLQTEYVKEEFDAIHLVPNFDLIGDWKSISTEYYREIFILKNLALQFNWWVKLVIYEDSCEMVIKIVHQETNYTGFKVKLPNELQHKDLANTVWAEFLCMRVHFEHSEDHSKLTWDEAIFHNREGYSIFKIKKKKDSGSSEFDRFKSACKKKRSKVIEYSYRFEKEFYKDLQSKKYVSMDAEYSNDDELMSTDHPWEVELFKMDDFCYCKNQTVFRDLAPKDIEELLAHIKDHITKYNITT